MGGESPLKTLQPPPQNRKPTLFLLCPENALPCIGIFAASKTCVMVRRYYIASYCKMKVHFPEIQESSDNRKKCISWRIFGRKIIINNVAKYTESIINKMLIFAHTRSSKLMFWRSAVYRYFFVHTRERRRPPQRRAKCAHPFGFLYTILYKTKIKFQQSLKTKQKT